MPTAHECGGMDELVAAAAVVSMVIDAKAPGDVGQRSSAVNVSTDDAAMPAAETLTEDKENNDDHAAGRHPEDVPSQVSVATKMPHRAPSA